MVVDWLFSNRDVVGVALAKAACGDTHELGAVSKIAKRFGSDISHSRAKPAEKLEDDV